ncbi:hypothetical protein [Aliikangiella maris]|uniref:Uncharacterized protein n=2 Tax=Aliikangiella maris TaxID=3162458 RepID=A0ABV3MKI6_9GAMM
MVNHPIKLKGSYLNQSSGDLTQPNIFAFQEQNFVESLLANLSSASGQEKLLQKQVSATSDDMMRLYQPVHRIFNLILLDACCLQYGEPRLAPEKILSSGFVIRKVSEKGQEYGWMKSQGKVVGWKPVNPIDTEYTDCLRNYDVDPNIRQQRILGSNRLILEQASPSINPYQDYSEDYQSLFLTPPKIMQQTRKTLLYGVMNLASQEMVEDDSINPPPFTKQNILQRLPVLLMQGGDERFTDSFPKPPTDALFRDTHAQSPPFAALKKLLSYLANEVGLFTGGQEVQNLKHLLQQIPVSFSPQRNSQSTNYYQFLLAAFQVFYGFPQDEQGQSQTLSAAFTPLQWPQFNTLQQQSLVNAIYATMSHRWQRVAPGETRYAGNNEYRLYAFIRVAGQSGCPVNTIWSAPTHRFKIVPWYESHDGVAPTQIELPDINTQTLKKLKPNVAFKVPESIQKFMDTINLNDILDGKKNEGSGIGFGMICGFSIPLITICAFIVLQIFLVLLNLLFWWLPFIKICIPFPKPK